MPRPKAKTGLRAYPLRLPDEMYQIIEQMAGEEMRPVNSQIIVLLKEAITVRKQAPQPLLERRPHP